MNAPAPAAQAMQSAAVLYLPGMAGMLRRDVRFCEAIREAGIEQVHAENWVRWPWVLQVLNLRDAKRHREIGKRLAGEWAGRGERLYVIGHSTGAAVALRLLEALNEMPIAQTWLLAAAVSRDYDLRPAMEHTASLFNLFSKRDVFHLCVGTSVVGSADGVHRPCAGFAAFRGPGSQSDRLTQVEYQHAWREHGHRGGHLSVLSAEFARRIIVPTMRFQMTLDGL
ncbi:MAG: hypothetical protein GC162_05755 [Planctomycetes bacterium]|nr:hypothetical protein [Planctomycetota bacterium]